MSRKRLLALVGVGVALWCALGASMRATTGARTTADEPQYLMTALSLARDGDLDVANQRAQGQYRSFHEVGLPLQERIQPDGSRVSPHDPLLPALLAVPTTWTGWLGAKLLLAAVAGALAASLLFIAEARLGVRRVVALPTVLAASLAAPLAVYSTQVYPEIVAALVVTIALAIVTAPVLSRMHAMSFAVVVSLLPWLSVKYAPVAVALGVVGAVRLDRRAFGVVVALAAFGFALAHQRWYGGLTPYAVGRHFGDGQLSVMGTPHFLGRSGRLVGLLVDRDFGVATWQPLFLAAVPAFVVLLRHDRSNAFVLGLPAAAGWLNASFVALTMHGWWFPGRQVIAVLPCLVLAIALAAERLGASVERWLWSCVVLGASMYAWLVVQVAATETRLITTFAQLSHPWWRAVRVALPAGRGDRAVDTLLLAAWTVVIAMSVLFSLFPPARLRRVPNQVQGAIT